MTSNTAASTSTSDDDTLMTNAFAMLPKARSQQSEISGDERRGEGEGDVEEWQRSGRGDAEEMRREKRNFKDEKKEEGRKGNETEAEAEAE